MLKKITILITLTSILLSCSSKTSKAIFNGQNLEGWVSDNPKCWKVKDGVLYGKNDSKRRGDILTTQRKDYKNFIFQLDFMMGEGKVDSGIFLRDGEEQIQIGMSGQLKKDLTGFPYIPALKGYPILPKDTTEKLKKDDWNTLKVKVVNSEYTTWLNNVKIMTYQSKTIIPKGSIGLQIHKNKKMSISFKNIFITELK